jgi:chorismate mutase
MSTATTTSTTTGTSAGTNPGTESSRSDAQRTGDRPAGQQTGTGGSPASAAEGSSARDRLDELDQQIIDLVQERRSVAAAAEAHSRAAARRAEAAGEERPGGLAREMEIFDRYRQALGRPGTQLAMTLLHLCRGRL